jgi:hypothetical protein
VRKFNVIGILHHLGNQFRSTTHLQHTSHGKLEVAEQRQGSPSKFFSVAPFSELDFVSVAIKNESWAWAKIRDIRDSPEDVFDLTKN